MSRSELKELLKQRKELNKRIKEAKRQEEMSNVESLIEDVKKSDEYALIADITKDVEVVSDNDRVQLVAEFDDRYYQTNFFTQETMSSELTSLKSRLVLFNNVKQITEGSLNEFNDIVGVDSGCSVYQKGHEEIEFIFSRKQIRASTVELEYSEKTLINGYEVRKQYQPTGYDYIAKELIVDLDCALTEALSQEKIAELTDLVTAMGREF